MHAGALLNRLPCLGGKLGLKCIRAALLYGALLVCASAHAAALASESGRFIALILPGKSVAFKPAVDAIKSGVLAAERAHGRETGFPVRIFDAGEREEETLSLFRLAQSQGAVAVIGPLTRSAMAYLADTADLSIPVLALNSFDETMLRRPRLFSLNLSIESEVRQIVQLMRSRQVANPVVLVMPGPLASRMAQAFANDWQAESGFVPLLIEVNHPRVQGPTLPEKLVGVDAVFFAADGRHASQLRPYLPDGLSFYATSQIVVGREVPATLSGVNYLEIPWLAVPDVPAYAKYGGHRLSSNDLERLFALGVDAWRLADGLARHQSLPVMEGMTGRLVLTQDGVFAREMLPRVAGERFSGGQVGEFATRGVEKR